jgi:hypothetical protein
VSEYLEVRCGAHRFLVPSGDVAAIEVIEAELAPAGRGRVPRGLLIDGGALAGHRSAGRLERGVALCAAGGAGDPTRVVVDQVGALVHCERAAIEPLPAAVAALKPYFAGVFRDQAAQEYLFCLRRSRELPVASFAWRRLMRRAALALPAATSGGGAP